MWTQRLSFFQNCAKKIKLIVSWASDPQKNPKNICEIVLFSADKVRSSSNVGRFIYFLQEPNATKKDLW